MPRYEYFIVAARGPIAPLTERSFSSLPAAASFARRLRNEHPDWDVDVLHAKLEEVMDWEQYAIDDKEGE